jgi:hypothetical protein
MSRFKDFYINESMRDIYMLAKIEKEKRKREKEKRKREKEQEKLGQKKTSNYSSGNQIPTR